jgi:hypothetical protein
VNKAVESTAHVLDDRPRWSDKTTLPGIIGQLDPADRRATLQPGRMQTLTEIASEFWACASDLLARGANVCDPC